MQTPASAQKMLPLSSLLPDSLPLTAEKPYGVSLYNVLFFKNNEYFSKIWPGYTLIGNSLNVQFHARLHERLTATAGAHAIYFYGDSQVYYFSPVFSLNFRPNERWQIVAGNLQSALQHALLEPMFNPENVFLHPQEKGIQFLYKGTKLQADIWIDWEKFILWGDPFQEWFTQGTSFRYSLLDKEKFSLQIPWQSVITHHGGQIDVSDKGVETLANFAVGYSAELKAADKQWIAEQYVLGFADLSPEKKYPFNSGRAFLSQLALKTPRFTYALGYWYGYYFLTAKGNPLFNNFNPSVPGLVEGQRSFVLARFELKNTGISHFRFNTSADVYYDVFNGYLEYSYGIYFSLNQFHAIKRAP